MFGRFRAADHKLAAKEFLIVQFLHRAFGFLDGLHLHESETFRALVVPVAHDLRVLHMANTVEQLEEIALCGVERQITNVKTRRSDFDRLRFARGPRLRLRCAIARYKCLFSCFCPVAEKCSEPLPECFLGSFRRRVFVAEPIAPSSGPATRTARASPR